MIQTYSEVFDYDHGQFFMYCLFCLKSDNEFKFVFGETHLIDEPQNIQVRAQSTKIIREHFQTRFQDIPVFVGGDFNEEP